MIVTKTTALILTMSLLAAAPSVAVKVFADNTLVQASDQQTGQSNAAQINQPGNGDGDRVAEIGQENNAVNLDRQEAHNIGDNNDDNTILQLSAQEIEHSNAALIDQPGNGDGDRVAEIGQENNAVNDHCQNSVGPVETTITSPCPAAP